MWWVNDVLYLPPPKKNIMLSRYLLLFLIPIEGLNYFSYHLGFENYFGFQLTYDSNPQFLSL